VADGPRADRLETSAFAFASDLAGEGVDTVLANLQERAGVGGIMAAFTYHAARDVFPHNPARRVQLIDRGEFYFPPSPTLYDGLRIQPRVNGLARQDVLGEACRRAAERGLAVHAWTVFLHFDRPDEYSDCTTENAFGDRYPADLCPSSPDVRAYARALVADVCRYDVTTVMAESLHFHGLEHGYHHERYFVELGARARFLLGLCFCEHCLARAASAGVDGVRVRAAARDELVRVFDDRRLAVDADLHRDDLADVAGGELDRYLDVRAETVASLVAEATEIAGDTGKTFVFLELSGAVKGYATGRPTGAPSAEIAWRVGVDVDGFASICPQFEVVAYAADVERVRLDLEAYRAQLDGVALSVALRPTSPDCDSPENLAEKIRLARELGIARVDFYHYGFVRLESLDWINAALEAA
jgi:hypothetical protein